MKPFYFVQTISLHPHRERILPYLDGANISIKAGSPSSFCKVQGDAVTKENIDIASDRMSYVRDSILYLISNGKLWEIRVIVGDGLNNTEKEREEIAEFLQTCGLGNLENSSQSKPSLHICQFRSVGVRKPYCDTISTPSVESLDHWKSFFGSKFPGLSINVQENN